MIDEAIRKVTSKGSLTIEEAAAAAGALLEGEVGDAEIAGLLVALKMKGETAEEIAGFALGLLERVERISPRVETLVDTCGTGGDRKGTFNISTASALIAAGAGAGVAKHGNRGVSSKCGSADVLVELGVNISIGPERVERCIESVGIGFLFAPDFHPAMKRVMGPRKALGVPTIFNVLGPLTNPAGAKARVIGVNRPELVPVFGRVLPKLGVERAFVLHGLDGMDEFTLADETLVCEVKGAGAREYSLAPGDLGFDRSRPEAFPGGDARRNAAVITNVLEGAEGPALDICVANAAFALAAAGKAGTLREGVALARESVRSGMAMRKLKDLIEFSNDGEAGGVS